MEALVSIIVPVYNLEGYVDNCLNSLVNQTYQNIEILCIDDGSTDKTADVIKSFAEKDDRVIYVYKENGGVSSARNLGLDMFKGDYVMFVDGDDYLHPQAVEIFKKSEEQSNCDVVCSNYEQVDTLGNKFKVICDYRYTVCSLFDFFEIASDMVCRSVWCKFFKRDLAKKFNFPLNVSNGEDTVYLLMILNECRSIAYVGDHLYFYYFRRGSASKNNFQLTMITMIDGLSDLCDYLKKKNSKYLLSQSLIMLYKTIFSIRTLCVGNKCEKLIKTKCKIISMKWLKNLLLNDCIRLKKKLIFLIFFYSRHLYELARLIQDPTMLDFYKNRRKQKGKSQKD